jgi:uncharacterized membrane protein
MALKLKRSLELLLILALAIGILLRFLNLGTRELWYDEVLSLLLSTGQKINYTTPENTVVQLSQYTALLNLPPHESIAKTLQGLFRGLYAGEPHPPLFFLGQHLWLRLFGNGEVAMRSLPALWSVGAIAATYGFGATLLGRRGGLLLAALLATNPFYLFHSLNVRMYTPLVFWAMLSVWALLKLTGTSETPQQHRRDRVLWQIVLTGAIAGGLLTFYLFAYWVIVLAALGLLLDRQHWLKQGLRLGIGVSLTLPWFLWGTLKQLQNVDLDRFSTTKQTGNAALLHLQNVIQTLGIHLAIGDWVTSLAADQVVLTGLVAALLLAGIIIHLWRYGDRSLLKISLVMGIFPLTLALAADVVTGKFTLGFGWGRTLMVIVPGCLLLLTLGIRQTGRWQEWVATGVLLLYLTIDVSDFAFRHRQVFHQVASTVQQDPTTPTLIALNSQAWGHLNRLAYYIPASAAVSLLAQPSAQLAPTLEKALTSAQYRRVLWLESADPLWSKPTSESERQQIEKILNDRFQLAKTQDLTGTMKLDQFSLKLYQTLP